MPKRPTIGITCSSGDIHAAGWDEHAAYSPTAYVRAVQRAGGRALLLVADEHDTEQPAELIDLLDGVILSGGASDVDPSCYRAQRHPATTLEPGRDAFEIALLRHVRAAAKPILGICRGMQVLNVAYGGTLIQHLPDRPGGEAHRRLPSGYASHEVRVAADTLAHLATGRRVEEVLSHHHQGVDRIGDGLTVTGVFPEDELVEAVEDTAAPFVLGVQWHPEADERSRVVGALVEAAGRA